MSKCRACGRPVAWLDLEDGKSIPVNFKGEWIRQDEKAVDKYVVNGELVTGRKAAMGDKGAVYAGVPHWMTCGEGAKKWES